MPGFYDAAASYRDSILTKSACLAGEDVWPNEPWQKVAASLARELRRYAELLDECAIGLLPGPIVFPSWSEPYEDHRSRQPAHHPEEQQDRGP